MITTDVPSSPIQRRAPRPLAHTAGTMTLKAQPDVNQPPMAAQPDVYQAVLTTLQSIDARLAALETAMVAKTAAMAPNASQAVVPPATEVGK